MAHLLNIGSLIDCLDLLGDSEWWYLKFQLIKRRVQIRVQLNLSKLFYPYPGYHYTGKRLPYTLCDV